MAEPLVSTLELATVGGVITLSGSIFGLEYSCLLAGLFGGLIALSFSEPKTKIRMLSVVLTSSLMAGYSTPILVTFILTFAAWTNNISAYSLKVFCAAIVGISCQTFIPAALGYLTRKSKEL